MNNIMNFKANAKVVIEQGEERLYSTYKPTVEKERVENVVIGVDSGSTQVRTTICRLADEIEAFDNVYVIPSTFTELKDTSEIVSDDTKLYYNMDSIISNNILPPYNKFDKARILRGNKFINANGAVARINSSIQKVDTAAFYINIIDAIAYSLIMDSAERNMPMADVYKVSLSCSLPPDDVTSTKNQQTFINSIKGDFNWLNNDLKVSFKIQVVNVNVTTEPEAAIKCHYMFSGDEIPESVLGLDAGGRSIGSEILFGGKSFDPARKTFRYGGNQLIDLIADKYVNKYGGSKPKEDAIKRALPTGLYSRAKNVTDITDIIIESKREFGLKLYGDLIKNVFDTQSIISADEIEAIVLTGRCFGRGDYDCSIADVIIEEFSAISPSCEIIQEDGYLIPVGNAIIGFSEFQDVLRQNTCAINRLPSSEDEIEEVAITTDSE